jgi:pSer/pThr/pTyr-binding forkhead associated (FHA) protein
MIEGRLRPPEAAAERGDLTPELIATDHWSDALVAAAGIPVVDVPIVTFGGGIGSFVLVDFLRVWGLQASDVRVLTSLDYPWQTYEYLTRCSQIPEGERLRSDSSSMPNNLWGFPSYAVQEAFEAKSLASLWNVFSEPIFCDYWTPKAGMVFRGLQKEADRIGYWQTVTKGQVRMVRRRDQGGYFTILTPPAGASKTRRVAFRSRVVHVAVGYPGLKFLPDLQAYREKYKDHEHVVNAYEPHEHVYAELQRRSGVVVVRGGGIVASRVLQRLIDDRDHHGAKTTIIHLFRTYISGAHGPNRFNRRRGGNGWAYQGFNYPKSVWGGELWERFRKLEGDERLKLYKIIGGTNTPRRKNWMQQQERGRREGWYRTLTGEVLEVMPGPDDKVVTAIHLSSQQGDAATLEVAADFIVDCTGLEADISEHRVLADLLEHSGAGRNVLGRLDVERTFEIRGTRSGGGRMYASGAAALGGYFPGVDTFLGLQLAAREITDDIAEMGMVPRLGSARSLREWWRWVHTTAPSVAGS